MSVSATQLELSSSRNLARAEPCADARDSVRLSGWLALLSFVLAGYAVLGKGFAYIGIPPLFIGEIALAAGLVSMLVKCRWLRLLDSPGVWLLAVFCGWCFLQTLPYLSTYGFSALRDAAVYGYSAFALVVMAHLMTRPEQLSALVHAYRRFAMVLVFALPPVWLLSHMLGDSAPRWPWAEVSILDVKGGNFGVHLAGVLAFWVAFSRFCGQVRLLPLLVLGVTITMAGAESRSGLLAFLLVLAICLAVHPTNRSLWGLASVGFCGLMLLAVSGLKIENTERDRAISFDQIVENVASIGGGSDVGDLEGTKEWRLSWWDDILGYTFGGKYFWTGKGFGINLADDDGYQGSDNDTLLRSPHNGSLTMLARAGVPGLLLWLAVLLVWASTIISAWLRARRNNQAAWAALFLVLFCYNVAILTQATFDVYLEGPVGGIWFWTIYGVGLAAVWLHRRRPEAFNLAPYPG